MSEQRNPEGGLIVTYNEAGEVLAFEPFPCEREASVVLNSEGVPIRLTVDGRGYRLVPSNFRYQCGQGWTVHPLVYPAPPWVTREPKP
jgi:hypothetical protein